MGYPSSQFCFSFFVGHICGGNRYTGAATLVWAMTEVTKNPGVMKKAQEELRSVLRLY